MFDGAVMAGVRVFRCVIDHMPMDDLRSLMRLVDVLSREHRQRHQCGECTHRGDGFDGSNSEHDSAV